ncbi:hypothetical protein KP509_1Z106300 [Ceratopteris richardii]|nr:hypothetical protein KP509_1Z106300 [Ceratopteris richardii]
MSWKKRKEIEVQKRVALGAKPEKGHRMPISMGLSIKRKRERLEEQKLQEDFALGRITKKWKKDTEKQTASDRGLKTSEGLFRGGVLYVKPLPQKREEKFQPSRGHGKSSKKHKKSKQKGKRKRR